MFSLPIERSLGEAFMYGDYDLEGDLFAAFTLVHVIFERPRSLTDLVDIAQDLLTLPHDGPTHSIERGRARLSGVKHSLARDRAAIQYHCRRLRLRPGERLLDIGCGWVTTRA